MLDEGQQDNEKSMYARLYVASVLATYDITNINSMDPNQHKRRPPGNRPYQFQEKCSFDTNYV